MVSNSSINWLPPPVSRCSLRWNDFPSITLPSEVFHSPIPACTLSSTPAPILSGKCQQLAVNQKKKKRASYFCGLHIPFHSWSQLATCHHGPQSWRGDGQQLPQENSPVSIMALGFQLPVATKNPPMSKSLLLNGTRSANHLCTASYIPPIISKLLVIPNIK